MKARIFLAAVALFVLGGASALAVGTASDRRCNKAHPCPTTTTTTPPPTTTTPPPTTTTTPSTRVRYDVTLPAGTAGLPRSESYCAGTIILNPTERRPENTQYNRPRDDLGTGWTDARFSWWSSFPGWLNLRSQVTGHFTGTTDEVFSWGACRWGVREDLLRAVAVQESDWHETFWGDRCSQTDPTRGIGSYGIMQVKNFNCSNEGDWGGYPRTHNSTPFNVDLYGAAFRGCLQQVYWYTIPAGDDMARRERGCVGAWFSGSYNPDIAYTNSVYQHLAARDWMSY